MAEDIQENLEEDEIEITPSEFLSQKKKFDERTLRRNSMARTILSFKQLQAFIVQQVVPEYTDASIEDIIKYAIDPATGNMGGTDSDFNPGISTESATNQGTELRFDLRFRVKRHAIPTETADESKNDGPPGNATMFFIIHLEPNQIDSLNQYILNRSLVYITNDITSQIPPGSKKAKYANVSEATIVWINFPSRNKERVNSVMYKRELTCTMTKRRLNKKGDTISKTEPYSGKAIISPIHELFLFLSDPSDPDYDVTEPDLKLITGCELVFGTAMDREQRLKLLKKMGVDLKGAEAIMKEYEEVATPEMMPSDYLIGNATKDLKEESAITLISTIHDYTQDKKAARTKFLSKVKTDDLFFTWEEASQLFEETWEELELA